MFNFISCNKTWKFSVLTSRDTQWLRISNAAPEGLCSSKIGMTNDWKLVWCTAEFLIVNFLETFAFTVALSPAHHYRAKVNKPWNQTVDGLQLSIIKQRTELSDMTKISPFLILDNRIINQKRAYHIFCALGHILYCGGAWKEKWVNWCDLMTSSNRLRLNLWFPLFIIHWKKAIDNSTLKIILLKPVVHCKFQNLFGFGICHISRKCQVLKVNQTSIWKKAGQTV